jgi:hypothetical protein
VVCAWSRTTLPVEVVGEPGSIGSVTFEVPAGRAAQVRWLGMQVHGLAYRDMVSVQVNSGEWMPLSNETATIAEPGRSFGGIGGGFGTLKLTLPLPAGAVAGGANTIRFRFNRTDGVVSGFRVLAFDLLDGDSRRLLEAEQFVQDNPADWTPPQPDAASIAAGRALWMTAPLTPGSFQSSPMIRARCADCHAHDGRDLKYFNFSNASIIARSRFHGLSQLQGEQIASYIRSLTTPSPGRPWNPPYQPGPGLDARPVSEWAAGAGVDWALENDNATLRFLFGATPADMRAAFRPDGNLNPREIPIALQLPDWSHWLPQIHPLDAWGAAFSRSEFALAHAAGAKSAPPAAFFERWKEARRAFLKPMVEGRGVKWTPELGVKAYSTELWQLVKTWEMTQEYGLEGQRAWSNTIPAAAAPAAVNIPDGPAGMRGSALTNEYFDAAWYELQVIVNSGNHRHRDRTPVDWVYVIGRYLDLYRESKQAEPARLLVAVIKAMQSTDPRLGPENRSQGWRPNQMVDPTIMISETWAPIFQALPGETKRTITEAMLAAWMEKNLQYPVARYFSPGLTESSYAPPASFGGISGGRPWKAAAQFRAAGVSPAVVMQLERWGAAYMETAARFQYTDSARNRGN